MDLVNENSDLRQVSFTVFIVMTNSVVLVMTVVFWWCIRVLLAMLMCIVFGDWCDSLILILL